MSPTAIYHFTHFTDTAHLPWILRDGELRPGRNKIGKVPIEFIWATASPIGDRTCAAMCRPVETSDPRYGWGRNTISALREGLSRLVRFTLPETDFLQIIIPS
jgi:hypothetical protein